MDIGHEDDYMGTLDLGDYLMVSAGNSNIDDVQPVVTDERWSACRGNRFARIEPCDNHEDNQLLYTDDENGRTHTANCKYCKYISRGEAHVYDEDGHCTLCGGEGMKYTLTFIYDNGIDDDKTVELIAGMEYEMPEFDGSLPEGKGFKCWLLENSSVSMECAPGDPYSIDDHSMATAIYYDLPKVFTITFDLDGGTYNGKPTYSVECTEGTVIILPEPIKEGYTFEYWQGSKHYAGDSYTVTGDHSFRAIWKEDKGSTFKVPKTGIE